MRILLRTDAGGPHGLGHAVRCKSLAYALQARGADVFFATDTYDILSAFVAPFPCLEAHTVTVFELDVLVVDTKVAINDAWYRNMARSFGCKVVRIDHPDATPDTCDLLIGPVSHWPTDTVTRLRAVFGDRFLYGWDYVMFDDEVASQPPIPYTQRQNGPIVFCAGGSDPDGALDQMWNWTKDLHIETQLIFCYGVQSTGILARAGQHYGPPAPMITRPPGHYIEAFTPRHLRSAALVVTTFGVTAYECLWWQTPVLCFGRTPEDVLDCRHLYHVLRESKHHPGFVACEPELAWKEDMFAPLIQDLWADQRYRSRMSRMNAGFLDGKGTTRVADAILALGA